MPSVAAVVACCAPNKRSLESSGAESSGAESREEQAGEARAAAARRRAAVAAEGAGGAPQRAVALLGPAVVVPWRKLPTADIVDVPASSAGAGEDASKIPARPYLELAGSPAGWAGRVMLGDGTSSAVAVRGGDGEPQVVVVGPNALAVSARSDGMWVLFRDRLVRWDERGAPQQTVMLVADAATAMIGAAGDAVWLVGQRQVWRVEREGEVRGPYEWEPGSSFAREEALCRGAAGGGGKSWCLKLEALGALGGARAEVGLDEKLALAGAQRTSRALPYAMAPGEEVLWFVGGEMITTGGAPGPVLLRSRSADAPALSLSLAVAGLDAGQRSFAVTSEDGALAVWRQSVRGRALEASPEGRRVSSEIGLPEGASIEGGEVSFYARGRRSAHHGEALLVSGVDEERYRHEVFPSSWTLSRRGAVAVWGKGEVAVATSGPDGIAVLPVYVAAAAP